MNHLPPLVRAAQDCAHNLQFPHSCIPEVGLLLNLLARSVRDGPIGEIGAGCGVGTAWLADGLAPNVELVTVELDPQRASAVTALVAGTPQVRVLAGDWHALLPLGPFDLLFADAKGSKDEPDALLDALRPGGLLLLDDFTPLELWPEEWCGRPDPVRSVWFSHPRARAIELRVSTRMAVILAVRID